MNFRYRDFQRRMKILRTVLNTCIYCNKINASRLSRSKTSSNCLLVEFTSNKNMYMLSLVLMLQLEGEVSCGRHFTITVGFCSCCNSREAKDEITHTVPAIFLIPKSCSFQGKGKARKGGGNVLLLPTLYDLIYDKQDLIRQAVNQEHSTSLKCT